MTPSPDFRSQSTKLETLCARLRELDTPDPLRRARQQVELLGEFDVYRWFVPSEFGGFGWKTPEIIAGYLQLSQASLSTAFVLTQRSGAVKRISTSENESLKADLLPPLASGDCFATVGISHLTTSRRHLGKPVLRAEKVPGGFRLNGFSPWVTGVTFADYVVVGATCDDETEILVCVPTDLPGISRPEPPQLVALSDSFTGELRLDSVVVDDQFLVGGPLRNIMSAGSGGNTGGLQTSTLALGLTSAALDYIDEQSQIREGFDRPAAHLREQWQAAREQLLAVAAGEPGCTNEALRSQANSLVLRSTQAALMVAKGAGYCQGHPVGRWCQEALFFLVWSCPQPVAESNLCELAQIA